MNRGYAQKGAPMKKSTSSSGTSEKIKPNETILTMSNMIVAYIMEEKPSDPAKEGSINRGSCASEKGPFFFPVVRYCGV